MIYVCFMLKGKLLILILTLWTSSVCLAQETKATHKQSDTIQIYEDIRICRDILFQYPDSAQNYVGTILNRSKKIDYRYGIYSAYMFKGGLFWLRHELDQAIVAYKQALKYSDSEKSPDRKAKALGNIAMAYNQNLESDSAILYLNKTIAFAKEKKIAEQYRKGLFDLGIFYLYQGNYIEAFRNFEKTKEEVSNVQDSVLLMHLYGNFGVLYADLNKFDSALLYYNKALEVDEKLSSEDFRSSNYLNLGELFFRQKKDYKSAIYYYKKALECAVASNRYLPFKLRTDINIGNVFYEQQNLDSAKKYYDAALRSPILDQVPDAKTALFVNLGTYYSTTNDFVNAQSYLDTGFALADNLGLMDYKKTALESMHALFEYKGDFKQSLRYYKQFHAMSDTLLKHESNKELAILEFEKFLQKELLDNQGLIKENKEITQRMILSIGVIVILLIFLYLLYHNFRKRKKLHIMLANKHNDLKRVHAKLKVANEQLFAQQKELKALNHSKDKLFSILGHDLKAPFNGIHGIVGLLTKNWNVINDREKKEMMTMLFSSSQRASALLDNILNWGMTQEGLVQVEKQNVVLRHMLNEIAELFELQLKNKELDLTIELPNDLIELDTDGMLLSRIVHNFINNAIKFTPKGGSIILRVEDLTNKIKLSVIDTGIGIPKDKISSIFNVDLGFRRSGTEGEQSTGMGLLLSKQYTKLIGASIDVISVEGKGSSFILSFTK